MPICLTFRQEVEGHALVYYMHMDKEMHKTSAETLTFLMNRKKKFFFCVHLIALASLATHLSKLFQ